MRKATLTALQGSILKWKLIEAGELPDLGSESCDLCHEFKPHLTSCAGCPVEAFTGESECERSPWVDWNHAQSSLRRYLWDDRAAPLRVADSPKLAALAKAEREFLESLLPANP